MTTPESIICKIKTKVFAIRDEDKNVFKNEPVLRLHLRLHARFW